MIVRRCIKLTRPLHQNNNNGKETTKTVPHAHHQAQPRERDVARADACLRRLPLPPLLLLLLLPGRRVLSCRSSQYSVEQMMLMLLPVPVGDSKMPMRPFSMQ